MISVAWDKQNPYSFKLSFVSLFIEINSLIVMFILGSIIKVCHIGAKTKVQ